MFSAIVNFSQYGDWFQPLIKIDTYNDDNNVEDDNIDEVNNGKGDNEDNDDDDDDDDDDQRLVHL